MSRLPELSRDSFLIIRAESQLEETYKIVDRNKIPFLTQIKSHLQFSTLDFVRIGRADSYGPNRTLMMIVNDEGYDFTSVDHGTHIENVPLRPKFPVNIKATELYHDICIPGTTHQIVGDVAIFHDDEF